MFFMMFEKNRQLPKQQDSFKTFNPTAINGVLCYVVSPNNRLSTFIDMRLIMEFKQIFFVGENFQAPLGIAVSIKALAARLAILAVLGFCETWAVTVAPSNININSSASD